ncbi:MAG: homogentisate 1,2-dioxygenase [Bacteroidia bacterium]|nr:homogentisate 1,2-dioxygenase [Bacteroidia bacterium]MCO5255043.1 homogentisate 1,2-dioxygenase [Bacteroidota bacterium]
MPFYQRIGQVPPKRHTQFRKPDGSLYAEELISTEGFSSIYSIVYHNYPPTMIKQIGKSVDISPKYVTTDNITPRCLQGFNVQPKEDYLESRVVLFGNNDVNVAVAAPKKSMTDYFFKNSEGDEIIFVHHGSGTMKSIYGELQFKYGDYIVVPRGTIYQMHFNDEDNRLLITQSFSPVTFPRRYTNNQGQLLEHSPFCERDIKTPQNLKTYDEHGDFLVKVRKTGYQYDFVYATHPFDAIGWDGLVYPYIFSIHDYEPITGRVHMPPPIHQQFEGHNFVICSFVPRMYDYHPLAIPAPYHHSNVDSDEVLYYVDGEFMSRKHVDKGMFTIHPKGIPHGPHPGTLEKSIGQKETRELAVMIDTFNASYLTQAALDVEDNQYYRSWLE